MAAATNGDQSLPGMLKWPLIGRYSLALNPYSYNSKVMLISRYFQANGLLLG